MTFRVKAFKHVQYLERPIKRKDENKRFVLSYFLLKEKKTAWNKKH